MKSFLVGTSSLFTRKSILALAVIVAIAAMIGAITFNVTRPTILKVGVGAPNTETTRLMATIAQTLAHEKSSVRLRAQTSDTPSDMLAALQAGKIDLAILRNDIALPDNARVVAIWQNNPLMLIVPTHSKISRWSALEGKTVGVLGVVGVNPTLFEATLAEQNVRRDLVKVIEVKPWEIPELTRKGEIQALFVVGPPSSRPIVEAISAFARELPDEDVTFVPVREADAIADRVTYFYSYDLSAGSVTANPPRPAESIKTISVTHYLLASTNLPDKAVAELTRQIFTNRPLWTIEHPAALRIEAPDTEKASVIPVHPGALEYLTGSEKSLMERYGDWIYMALFLVSLGGSAVAALWNQLGLSPPRQGNDHLQQVIALVKEAREAANSQTLDAIARQADDVFIAMIDQPDNAIDEARLATLSLALDHLRASIADRRRVLTLIAVLNEGHEVPTSVAALPKA